MMYRPIFLLLFLPLLAKSQMISGVDTLYGNEWVRYNQTYFKFLVAEEKVFRISYATLDQAFADAGLALSSVPGNQFAMMRMGQEIPIYVSTNGILGANDYIEFCGKPNQGELDAWLYGNNLQPNPYYSLFSDSIAYFLTFDNQVNHLRYALTVNDLQQAPTAETYYMHEDLRTLTNAFNEGKSWGAGGLYSSAFDMGEGWMRTQSALATQSFSTSLKVASGPYCVLETRVFSNESAHQFTLEVGNNLLENSAFNGYASRLYRDTFPVAFLGNNTTTIRFSGQLGGQDRHAPAYVLLKYPRAFNFGNLSVQAFNIDNAGQSKYLEINNFNSQGDTTWLFDTSHRLKMAAFVDPTGLVKIVLPASPTPADPNPRHLILASSRDSVTSLSPVRFTDFRASSGNYLIISHPKLMDDGQGGNPVQEYADYRQSTGHQPIIANAQELYDQFAFGIQKHPLAVQHFIAFAQHWWGAMEYVFLIGKGRQYQFSRNSLPADLLVPTYGSPASDALLACSPGSNVPMVPIGRLAATEPSEVRDYLNKVRGVESNANLPQTIADRSWMKNVLHLGGGNPGAESNTIKAYLGAMENTIVGANYGAKVESFFKTITDPIQISQSDFLDSLINAGVSLITFFGHSSPNSFDFNLDRPENYHNLHRHPIILSLGCYTGLIHLNGSSIARDFVLIPEKGAIGFLASSGAASTASLNAYAEQFYRLLGSDFYGSGVGKIMQEVNRDYTGLVPRELEFSLQQMTLHGDPALRFNAFDGPDYTMAPSSVSIVPNVVTTRTDSIDILLTIHNIGKAIDTTMRVEIRHVFPDGSSVEVVPPTLVAAPYFQNQYTFRIGGEWALGENHFQINIDSDNALAELPAPAAESNNALDWAFYVYSDDIIPIWPNDFDIVGAAPALRASVPNAFAAPAVFRIQIDTTEYFNSPFLKQATLIQGGGLLEWQPNAIYTDSTVYYWRVSPDSLGPNSGFRWKTQSFVYLSGQGPGWSQSHLYQWQKDRFRNMYLSGGRRLEFINTVQTVDLENAYTNIVPFNRIKVFLNNSEILYDLSGSCPNRKGLCAVVLDPHTLQAWQNPANGNRFGSLGCNQFETGGFFWPTDSANIASRLNFISFLRDSVPSDHYVLVFSLNDYESQHWDADQLNFGSSIFDVLESNGAAQIRQTAANRAPFAFFFQKNNPNYPIEETYAPSDTGIITPDFDIAGNWDEGSLQSVSIGPAKRWTELQLQTSAYDANPTDTFSVSLYGIDTLNNEHLLDSMILAQQTNLANIDAQVYPKLRLQFHSKDPVFRSSRQLDYWRILYEGYPEAALRPETFFSFEPDTLEQGQNLRVKMLAQNVGKVDMDSMLVRFSVAGLPDRDIAQRLRALPAGDTLMLEAQVDTRGMAGTYTLAIELNPDEDQPELYHFNNLATKAFRVRGDRINPLMDITFDGEHIMNGDIVSARPEILVSLRDENTNLALDDTSSFKLFLRNPAGILRQVYFTDPSVQFFPADTANLEQENQAQIVYMPHLQEDGEYTLLVQGQDRSGNASGQLSYKVVFRVINRPMISNLFNYPNPFTTSTRFVFTLTGAQIPSNMSIQIFTVTGKVVREIGQEELGPIRVGNNLTEFAWDGTDQYGDRLANGTYLYRVLIKGGEQEYGHYDNGTDQYFNGGFGKMYLFR